MSMANKSGTLGEVLFERVGEHVVLVTLNRPDAHNAVNVAVAEALEACVMQIEADPTIRAAVLAARGKSFCAGADLREVAAGRALQLARPETGFAGFVYAAKSKPWIAAVQGAAFGGGTEIALACDMIIAGEKASFALPEVKRGLIAGAGGAYRVTNVLPRPVAIEMVVTGEPIGAQRAYELGLVNHLVAGGEEVAAALRLAETIARNAPLSVRESLRLTRFAADRGESENLRLQEEVVTNVLASPNLAEGAKAFIEKRAPVWTD